MSLDVRFSNGRHISPVKVGLVASFLTVFPFLVDVLARRSVKALLLAVGVLGAYSLGTLFLVLLDVLVAHFSSGPSKLSWLEEILVFALYFIFTSVIYVLPFTNSVVEVIFGVFISALVSLLWLRTYMSILVTKPWRF